jgi:hypothetical protein
MSSRHLVIERKDPFSCDRRAYQVGTLAVVFRLFPIVGEADRDVVSVGACWYCDAFVGWAEEGEEGRRRRREGGENGGDIEWFEGVQDDRTCPV